VEIGNLMHRCVSRIQQTRATQQQYADVTNFVHAVVAEWNRMRRELDTGGDLRVTASGEGKLVRELRKRVREQSRQITELNKRLRAAKQGRHQ
jgi:uncharacterized protein involved in exopolysaccharide biosynthesis